MMKFTSLMFFLYLFLNYTMTFNIIRQGIAIVIIAYSYKFIFDRNFKKFYNGNNSKYVLYYCIDFFTILLY